MAKQVKSTRQPLDRYLERHKLTTLDIFLADERDAGRSPQQIAADLADFTDGIWEVNSATIRRWLAQADNL